MIIAVDERGVTYIFHHVELDPFEPTRCDKSLGFENVHKDVAPSGIRTDSTKLKINKYKKWVVILVILLSIISGAIIYFTNKQKDSFSAKDLYKPESKQQDSRSLWNESIHIPVKNNYDRYSGIFKDARKTLPRVCPNTTWFHIMTDTARKHNMRSDVYQLMEPSDMVVDDQNSIYIVDFSNHSIIRWKQGNRQSYVVAGGNGKGNKTNQLNYPTAVFVDNLKNIYISDNGNSRIQKWRLNSTEGETIIGHFGRGNRSDQINNCWGLYVDHEYNIYVSELSNHRITKWSPGTQFGQIIVRINKPMHIYVDEKTNDIYVASYEENFIKQFGRDGSLIHNIGKGLVKQPRGFIIMTDTLTKSAYMFLADSGHHRILKIEITDRTNIQIVAGTNNQAGKESNQMNKPFKVQLDAHANLLVLDFINRRIQNFSLEKKDCDGAQSILRLSYNDTDSLYPEIQFHTNASYKSQNQIDSNNISSSNRKHLITDHSSSSSQRLTQNDTRRSHWRIPSDLHNWHHTQDHKVSDIIAPFRNPNSLIGEDVLPEPTFDKLFGDSADDVKKDAYNSLGYLGIDLKNRYLGAYSRPLGGISNDFPSFQSVHNHFQSYPSHHNYFPSSWSILTAHNQFNPPRQSASLQVPSSRLGFRRKG